jgi:hypothetical protein
VDIDTKGNNLFDTIDERIEERRKEAFRRLGISEGFQYTKLY